MVEDNNDGKKNLLDRDGDAFIDEEAPPGSKETIEFGNMPNLGREDSTRPADEAARPTISYVGTPESVPEVPVQDASSTGPNSDFYSPPGAKSTIRGFGEPEEGMNSAIESAIKNAGFISGTEDEAHEEPPAETELPVIGSIGGNSHKEPGLSIPGQVEQSTSVADKDDTLGGFRVMGPPTPSNNVDVPVADEELPAPIDEVDDSPILASTIPPPSRKPETDNRIPVPETTFDAVDFEDDINDAVDELQTVEDEPLRPTGYSSLFKKPESQPKSTTTTNNRSVRLGTDTKDYTVLKKAVKIGIAAVITIGLGVTAYLYKDKIQDNLYAAIGNDDAPVLAGADSEKKSTLEESLSKRHIFEKSPVPEPIIEEPVIVPTVKEPKVVEPKIVKLVVPKPTVKPIQQPLPNQSKKAYEKIPMLDELLTMEPCGVWDSIVERTKDNSTYSPYHKVPIDGSEVHVQNYINFLDMVSANEIDANPRLKRRYNAKSWKGKKDMKGNLIWKISDDLGINLNKYSKDRTALATAIADKFCPDNASASLDINLDSPKFVDDKPDTSSDAMADIMSLCQEYDDNEQLNKDMYCGETEDAVAILNKELELKPYVHDKPITPIPLEPELTYEQELEKETAAFMEDLPEGWGSMYKQAEQKALDNSIARGEADQTLDELYKTPGFFPAEYRENMEKESFLDDMPEGFAALYEESEKMAEKNAIARGKTEETLNALYDTLGMYSNDEKVEKEKEKFLNDMPDTFAALYEESEKLVLKNEICMGEADKELESLCELLAA